MVNKNVIERLSNFELELYVKPDSKYVSDAIEIAFETLKHRNRVFSDSETNVILDLIAKRRQEEKTQEEEDEAFVNDPFLESNITDDCNAVALYPSSLVIIGSIFLTSLFGSILLFINFIKLKKYLAAALVIIFGFIFTHFQLNIVALIYNLDLKPTGRYSLTPELLSAVIGCIILLIFWHSNIPKDLKYRKASYILPIILVVVFSFGIYLDYLGVDIVPFQLLRYLR